MRQIWGAALLFVPVAGAAAPMPRVLPDRSHVETAITRYNAAPWHFAGRIDPPRGQAISVLLALTPRADGQIEGELLTLAPGGGVTEQSPVAGHVSDLGCRLTFDVADRPVRLDGLCSATVVSGQTSSVPTPPGLISDVLFWWRESPPPGEAWLAADAPRALMLR